jgi:hypothetical protein
LPRAKGDDEPHASRPRRQHIGDWQELQRKRRQQERVESNEPPGQSHSGYIEQLIGKRPPEWAEHQLKDVCHDRHREGEAHPLRRQNGRLEPAQEGAKHVSQRV